MEFDNEEEYDTRCILIGTAIGLLLFTVICGTIGGITSSYDRNETIVIDESFGVQLTNEKYLVYGLNLENNKSTPYLIPIDKISIISTEGKSYILHHSWKITLKEEILQNSIDNKRVKSSGETYVLY